MQLLQITLFVFFSTNIFLFNGFYSVDLAQTKAKKDSGFTFTNKTYKKSIKTVLIHKKGWQLSFPIIDLNNEDEKITLSFDELGADITDYYWEIIHCNANWTKSELEPIDYINGFNDGDIYEYSLSKNTTTNYVNYTINFPNGDISFQKSGNYIVKIYEQSDTPKITLTRRFYVIDKKVIIKGNIFKQPLLNNANNQRTNLEITYIDEITDAYNNLCTYIIKNGESSISTNNIRPSKIGINKISYENINKLSFAGGNEFRHFDIKSLRFLSDKLETINYMSNRFQVILRPNESKAQTAYSFKNDLNGKSLIELENSRQSNIEADYCDVTFRLQIPININKGNYFVFGALTDWQNSEQYKMSFDEVKQEYTLSLLLKQGYYNYQYIFKSDGLRIDETSQWFSVEGNKHQTENDYYILSYYKNPTEQFEELVGFAKINSNSTP